MGAKGLGILFELFLYIMILKSVIQLWATYLDSTCEIWSAQGLCYALERRRL